MPKVRPTTQSDEDAIATALVRNIERRIFWSLAFALCKPGYTPSAAAKAADEALNEYERRFPAIRPDGRF